MADVKFTIQHAEEIQIPPMPIPAPLTLILSGESASILRVGWTDSGILAQTYQIEYATNPAFTGSTTINNIMPTPGAGGFYDITGLNLLTANYYVRLRAVNSGGASAWQYGTFTIPVPDMLQNLVLTAIAGPGIKVDFDDPGMFAVQYDIHWSISSNFVPFSNTTIASNPEGSTSHNITGGIASGTLYYVRVRAKNGAIASNWIQATVNT